METVSIGLPVCNSNYVKIAFYTIFLLIRITELYVCFTR